MSKTKETCRTEYEVNPWECFMHSLNVDELELVLKRLYGINVGCCDNKKRRINQIALDSLGLCRILGGDLSPEYQRMFVTNFESLHRYVPGIEDGYNIGVYLALDALLHICALEAGGKKRHENFKQQLESYYNGKMYFPRACDTGSDPWPNDNRKFKKLTAKTVIGRYLGADSIPDSEYVILKFSKLLDPLIWYLMVNISINPFKSGSKSALSNYFEMLEMKSFSQSFLGEDKATEYVSLYLLNRIYGFSALSVMSKMVSDFVRKKENKEFPLQLRVITKYLSPIFFVQDCINTEFYVKIVEDILNGKTISFLEHINNDEGVLASIWKSTDSIEKAKQKLLNCKQYIMFLATHYLPALSATFYALFMKTYNKDGNSLDDLKELLVKYINREMGWNATDKLKCYTAQYEEMKKHVKRGRPEFGSQVKIFEMLFNHVHKECMDYKKWEYLTRLDYTDTDNEYQALIMEAVMRKKLSFDEIIARDE